MIVSARAACAAAGGSRPRAVSRADRSAWRVGPRLRARPATSSPWSRWRRQFTRCELYNPSRRNSAPSSPRFLHASASLRIRSRYCRGEASGAGPSPALQDRGRSRATGWPKAAVALRAPSASGPSTPSISTAPGMRFIHRTLPAPTLISPGKLSHGLLAQGGAGRVNDFETTWFSIYCSDSTS